MNYYLPRLGVLILGLIAFAIGLYLQKQERKRKRERKEGT